MRMLCERGGAASATVLLAQLVTPAVSSSCHFDHRTLLYTSLRSCADRIRDNEDTESLLT